ncbi:hypothetical protein FJY63_08065, partial [Candidatus Sumerlaeota bacterium]|nr:hypothetical protein [Candidatus Sumerlaeota bacterium]
VDYLLNPTHGYGASKAQFFMEFGFRVEEWEAFAAALREHGSCHNVVQMTETMFGPRFEVDGPLLAPDGRQPQVRTVWQLDVGEIAPWLITAHPLEASHD